MKEIEKYIRWAIYVTIIGICIIMACVITLVDEHNKSTSYDELTYFLNDFHFCYDDDEHCYEIFTDDKKYIIHEKQLSVKYDRETHIIIYDNNYDWHYNKAILFLGVEENDK